MQHVHDERPGSAEVDVQLERQQELSDPAPMRWCSVKRRSAGSTSCISFRSRTGRGRCGRSWAWVLHSVSSDTDVTVRIVSASSSPRLPRPLVLARLDLFGRIERPWIRSLASSDAPHPRRRRCARCRPGRTSSRNLRRQALRAARDTRAVRKSSRVSGDEIAQQLVFFLVERETRCPLEHRDRGLRRRAPRAIASATSIASKRMNHPSDESSPSAFMSSICSSGLFRKKAGQYPASQS